jgi:hypothetical protein
MPNPDPSPAITRQHRLGDEELGKADARPGGNWLRALLDDCRADRVSGVVLASQWLRARVAPTRLEATGPWSTALGRLVLAALLPPRGTAAALLHQRRGARLLRRLNVAGGSARGYSGCEVTSISAPWISWSWIIGIHHAAVPPRHWRTAWEDAVTPRSFVNGFWTSSRPDGAPRTSPATWGISDQTVYSWRRQDRVDRGLIAA